MNGLAQTACRRCRDQKLRCSREQPECARCHRLRTQCSYPEPPDRKRLAATRRLAKKRRSEDQSTSDTTPRSAASVPEGDPILLDCNPLPGNVQQILINTYFVCVFNASLCFHRPTFDKALASGRMPQHTLLAVFALASRFLSQESVHGRQHAAELNTLGDLSVFGRQWALTAGKEALSSIDRPTIWGVRTCQILSLYWFSMGDSQRNTMFAGISQRGIRVLLLDAKDSALPGGASDIPYWLKDEILRRSFWVAWIQNGINSDHYVFGSSSDTRALNLPLPISEESYAQSIEEPTAKLIDVPEGKCVAAHMPPQTLPSLMAEIMNLLRYWTKIRDTIVTNRTSPSIPSLFELNSSLSSWTSSLPSSLTYSKHNLQVHGPNFVLLHALHYQCGLILHAAIVPQFSGCAPNTNVPPEVVRVSAEIAVKAAHDLSQLASDLIELEIDVCRLAPFLGYCHYVAATVLMVVRDDKKMMGCLRVLRSMMPFWKNLERLWSRVQILYGAQSKGAGGRLIEPLEHSVLEYSLRRLSRDLNVEDESGAIESAIDLEVQAPILPQPGPQDSSMPIQQICETAIGVDEEAVASALDAGLDESWHWDDSVAVAMSFDDFFGLDGLI